MHYRALLNANSHQRIFNFDAINFIETDGVKKEIYSQFVCSTFVGQEI